VIRINKKNICKLVKIIAHTEYMSFFRRQLTATARVSRETPEKL